MYTEVLILVSKFLVHGYHCYKEKEIILLSYTHANLRFVSMNNSRSFSKLGSLGIDKLFCMSSIVKHVKFIILELL